MPIRKLAGINLYYTRGTARPIPCCYPSPHTGGDLISLTTTRVICHERDQVARPFPAMTAGRARCRLAYVGMNNPSIFAIVIPPPA